MNTRQAVAIRIQQLCAENGYNINSLARKAAVPPTTVMSDAVREFSGSLGSTNSSEISVYLKFNGIILLRF